MARCWLELHEDANVAKCIHVGNGNEERRKKPALIIVSNRSLFFFPSSLASFPPFIPIYPSTDSSSPIENPNPKHIEAIRRDDSLLSSKGRIPSTSTLLNLFQFHALRAPRLSPPSQVRPEGHCLLVGIRNSLSGAQRKERRPEVVGWLWL